MIDCKSIIPANIELNVKSFKDALSVGQSEPFLERFFAKIKPNEQNKKQS